MIWTTVAPAVTTAFLSSVVEAVEALTIVLAVASVRGWRPDTIFEHPKKRAAHLELIQQEGCARGQARQRAKKLGMIKGGLSQPIRSTSTREGSLPSDAPRSSSVAAETRVRSCSTMRKSMTSGR